MGPIRPVKILVCLEMRFDTPSAGVIMFAFLDSLPVRQKSGLV